MTLLAHDLFSEASTIDLSLHTADVGGGWTDAGGGIQVIAGAGVIEDQNSGSGNRYNLTTGLAAGIPMEVKCTIATGDPANTFPGVAARRTSAASGGTGYEFRYLSGAWNLTDQSAAATLTEAWDGSPGEFKLHVEDGLVIGYFNGVEKVRLTNNAWPSGAFAGLLFGNFTGTAFKMQGSAFQVDSVSSLLVPANDDSAPHLLHRPSPSDAIVTVFM